MNKKKDIINRRNAFYLFLFILFAACLWLRAWLAAAVVFMPGLLYYSISVSNDKAEADESKDSQEK